MHMCMFSQLNQMHLGINVDKLHKISIAGIYHYLRFDSLSHRWRWLIMAVYGVYNMCKNMKFLEFK